VGKLILLVDDDEDVRSVAEMMLTDFGYDVAAAAEGGAALRIARERQVDLLFTDVMMPGMNGFELAAAVRRLRPGLPVIAATGYMSIDACPDCPILLRKPYRPHQLEAALRQLLG